jgi:hypothetical protein
MESQPDQDRLGRKRGVRPRRRRLVGHTWPVGHMKKNWKPPWSWVEISLVPQFVIAGSVRVHSCPRRFT